MRILRKGSWNDDRLDEFSRRTDEGFKEVNQRLDRLTYTFLAASAVLTASIIGSGFLG